MTTSELSPGSRRGVGADPRPALPAPGFDHSLHPDVRGAALACELSRQTGQEVTWTAQGFAIGGTHVSSPEAVLAIGARSASPSKQLEDVLRAYPGWMIGESPETGRWAAIRWPRPGTEIYVHAGTLDELAAKLSAEPS